MAIERIFSTEECDLIAEAIGVDRFDEADTAIEELYIDLDDLSDVEERLGREIHDLKEQISILETANEDLEAQVDELSDYDPLVS